MTALGPDAQDVALSRLAEIHEILREGVARPRVRRRLKAEARQLRHLLGAETRADKIARVLEALNFLSLVR